MGRALARDPKLFLFDEPLSNLDAKLRVEMRAELKLLHQRSGTTTLYVTHDQVEAMTLGDRIAVMRDGALQQIAPPDEIYGRPANRFVAEFIGSPPMNMIEAGRDASGGLVSHGCALPLDEAQRRALAASGADKIDYGLRAEVLHCTDDTDALLPGTVRLVEPTGPETFTFLDSPVGALMCRTPGRLAVKIGDTVRLRWSAADVHLFDARTQRRVGL
jgi:multiple sugar transport system ATP-binding protein